MGNTTPQAQLLPGSSSSKRTSERFDIVEGDSAEYSPPTSPAGSGRSLMSSPPALGGVPISHSAPLPSPRNRPKERETSSWFNFGTSPKSSAAADALTRPASPRVAPPSSSVATAAPPSSPRVPSSSSFNAHRTGQPASPRVPASSSFSSSQRDLLVRTTSAALTAPSGAAPLAPLQPGHSPSIPVTLQHSHARPSSPPSPPVPASPPPSPPRSSHDSDVDIQQQQQQQLLDARRPKKGASLTKLVFELESPEPLRVRASMRDAAGNLAPASQQSAAELSAKIDRLFSGVHSILIVDRELRVLYKDRVPDDSRDVVDIVSIFQRVRQTVDNLSQSLIELEEDWSVLHLRSGSQLFSAYSLRGSLFFLLFFAPHSPDDLVSADLSMRSICDQYTELVLVDELSDNDLSDY